MIRRCSHRRYAVVRPWGVLPAHIEYGVVSHVRVDSHDNLYVFQRGEPPVVVFDPMEATCNHGAAWKSNQARSVRTGGRESRDAEEG